MTPWPRWGIHLEHGCSGMLRKPPACATSFDVGIARVLYLHASPRDRTKSDGCSPPPDAYRRRRSTLSCGIVGAMAAATQIGWGCIGGVGRSDVDGHSAK